MNEFTCIEKIRDKHLNVTDYILVDKENNKIKVDRLGMKAMLSFKCGMVSNLKLTSDGRIINKTEDDVEVLDEKLLNHLEIVAKTLWDKFYIKIKYEMMYDRGTDNKVYVITNMSGMLLVTLTLTDIEGYYSIKLETTINNVKYDKTFDVVSKSGLDDNKLKDFSTVLYKLIVKIYKMDNTLS